MATTNADARWWVRYPRRWRQETAELRAAGATYRILRVNPSQAEPEVRQIAVEWPNPDGDSLAVIITYPDAYPFFPPTFATVEPQGITRHRNPVSGQLCLVADGQWHPNLTAATVLAEQVPMLLAANQEDSAIGPGTDVVEMDEAEGSRVFVIGTAIAALFTARTAPAARATGTCGLARVHVGSSSPGLTLVVDELAGLDGRIPDRPDDVSVWEVHPLTTSTRSVPWVRLDRELLPSDSADALWEWAVDQLPGLHQPSRLTPFILVAFRDEVAHREIGWRWLVIFRLGEDRSVWAFGQDVSPQALRARVPGYEGLADASVVVVGAGSLGLPIAVGLARLGIGDMHIVDGAGVRAATVCRQHTLADVGHAKADAVANAAAMVNPYLRVTGTTVTIGHSTAPNADVGAQLAQAEATRDFMTAEAARATALFRKGALSVRAHDSAVREEKTARAAVASALANLAVREKELESALAVLSLDRTGPSAACCV